MTHLCRSCREGLHPACSGLRCSCTATPRCRRNAALVEARTMAVAVAVLVLLFIGYLTTRGLSSSADSQAVTTMVERPVQAASIPELVAPSPSTSAVVTPERQPVGQVTATSSGPSDRLAVWYRLADCESGDWDRNGRPIPGTARWDARGGGHEGGLQFLPSTWRQAGGNAVATHAYEATAGEQITVARIWLGRTSVSQWPVCGPKVGLSMADALKGDDV